MRLIFGYLRSTNLRPGRNSSDLAIQRASLQTWSDSMGMRISEFVIEPHFEATTAFDKRTVSKTLIEHAGNGGMVVAASFGNLFGTPEDAHRTLLLARLIGCHIRACDMEDGRRNIENYNTLLTALLAVSAGSTYPATLRNRAVKKREAESSRYRGGNVIFGWTKLPDGSLTADEAEQNHIEHLQRLRFQKSTYEELAKYSAEQGFHLTAPGIHKILRRVKLG